MDRRFNYWCRVSDQTTEFLWKIIFRSLRRKKKNEPAQKENVLVLGDQQVPENHLEVLRKGPKFAFAYSPPTVEKLVVSKAVSNKATSDERQRAAEECAEVATRTVGHSRNRVSLRPLVDYFVKNNLRVPTSDKEGHFVVMTDHLYAEKTKLALTKNFRIIEPDAKGLTQRASDFLDDVGLEDVATKLKKAP